MLSQGVTNVSTGCDECFDEVKGVCNNSANKWFLKAQKDKMLTIRRLQKTAKLAFFQPNPVLLIYVRFSRFFSE